MTKKTSKKAQAAQAMVDGPGSAHAVDGPRPVRACDLAVLRYALGVNYTDLKYLLGGTSEAIAQGADNERILNPAMSILARLLWNNPQDAPKFQAPDFSHIRTRFGLAFQKLVGRGGRGGRSDIPSTLAAVMSGAAQSAGSEWSSGHQTPSPAIQRLFWLLDLWADQYGEEEALRRWLAAVEEEAQARGVDLNGLFALKTWPRLPDEKRYRGGAAREGSTDDDADE